MITLRDIFKSESTGGILLFLAALLALIISNSPLHDFYSLLLKSKLTVHFGNLILDKPLNLWINDGLMAIFFLLVGLEIKRECLSGVLKDRQAIILPAVGALGGLVLPAVIYAYINWYDAVALRGWAIPVATDIAFSLGILSLLGTRIPTSVKIFLTALAIIDDIVAIIIIAVFYTSNLSLLSLAIAGLSIFFLIMLNRFKVKNLGAYFIIGLILWLSVLQSGVHATLAGIVLAFAIPLDKDDPENSPLEKVEQTILPWVTYFVLPMFAFANSGLSFSGMSVKSLHHPITLAISGGLFLGKQIGIFFSCFICIKLGLAKLPEDMDLGMLYGVALLCGVGFTMSLFIGSLAFTGEHQRLLPLARLGILFGSTFSGMLGYYVLSLRRRK